MPALPLLLLLLVANGAPILARKLFGTRWQHSLDGGHRAWDGRPSFGPAKTWRGLLASLVASSVAAWLLGLPAAHGAVIAAAAMVGDLLSSFIKRRLNIAPSGMALGLDQIPEALLPLLVMGPYYALDKRDIAILVLVFLVLELVLSRILYRLHIRKRPY